MSADEQMSKIAAEWLRTYSPNWGTLGTTGGRLGNHG